MPRRHILAALILAPLALAPAVLRAEAVVVAVDAPFAPVAQVLTRSFTERTGHELSLEMLGPKGVPAGADVVLAPDAALPRALIDQGLADAASRVTYAMGATGTAAATQPRDAVLMLEARDKAVARDFLAYLMTSDAWDLIVTHGYGAY